MSSLKTGGENNILCWSIFHQRLKTWGFGCLQGTTFLLNLCLQLPATTDTGTFCMFGQTEVSKLRVTSQKHNIRCPLFAHLWRKCRHCAPGHGRPFSVALCKCPHVLCVPPSRWWRIRRRKSSGLRRLKEAAGHLVDRVRDLGLNQSFSPETRL